MDITWVTITEVRPKEVERKILRKVKMGFLKVLKEMYHAIEKLGYKIFLIKKNTISLLKYDPKKNKNDEHASGLEDELGDILYTLACFANAHGINLDNAMEKSIKKVQLRDKNRF